MSTLLRDIWNFDQSKNPSLFYGKLSDLNNFLSEVYSLEQLKELQIQTLKRAYGKNKPYKQLNKFLKEIQKPKNIATDADLFSKLAKGVNAGLDGNGVPKDINTWDSGAYLDNIKTILAELTTAIDKAANSTDGIDPPSLDRLENFINGQSTELFKDIKGDFLEEIGTWVMVKAGLFGASTGAWVAKDKFFNEAQAQQVIEDVMGFLFDDAQIFTPKPSLSNSWFLSYKITGYKYLSPEDKQIKNAELENWVKNIEQLNGLKVKNGQVIVTVDKLSSIQDFFNWVRIFQNHSNPNLKLTLKLGSGLYEELQKLSVNIQAKSNVGRHLTNNNKRSLYSINTKDKYYNQLVYFNSTKPVQERSAVSEQEYNQPLKIFAAYANFCLSKDIAKRTIYGRNQFYLTEEGFSDLSTLMSKRGFAVRISETAVSYQRFLENSYNTIYSNI